MKHQVTIGCFGIITDGAGRVLLGLRQDSDLWNLPGGGLEPNETPWECVTREIKEETGILSRPRTLFGVYSKPQESDIVFLFICKKIGGKLEVSSEAKELGYFSLDTLPENILPGHKRRIEDYYRNPNALCIQAQYNNCSIVKEMN